MTSAERRRRNTKKSLRMAPEEEPEFQIAPMIDILLVILVFFMSISSSEALEVNREVQLPVAEDTADDDGDNPGEMKINVDWNIIANAGVIEYRENPFGSADELRPQIEERFRANPLLRVLIRADKGVPWEYTRELLKAVGDTGISQVVFSVVNKDVADASADDASAE